MATLKNVDTHGHRYWLRYPDGKFTEILPAGFQELSDGHYEITSVEPVHEKPTPHLPPPAKVNITNVGQETIFFHSVHPLIKLGESQSTPLRPATYYLSSVHIPPPKYT